MKTNINQFHAQVKELAVEKQRPYYTVKCELGQHIHKDGSVVNHVEFQCYVDGYGIFSAKTTKECLSQLKAAMYTVEVILPEVTIEV